MICARGLFGSTSDGNAVCMDEASAVALWSGAVSCAETSCGNAMMAKIKIVQEETMRLKSAFINLRYSKGNLVSVLF